ncbi:MAG: terminase large subunit [Defluviitaleaceae bacterium]|nr:terminase large subunit [Defluviitaleaceae bacterium]MCL2263786.1 terminase large subunit [Defluviitaleaceae bacterium]
MEQSKAYKYARWCIENSNRKVGKYIKKQAAQWLKIADEESAEAFVCANAYHRICGVLKLMIHPDLQIPLHDGLEDYAWFLITAVLCTKLKTSDGSDVRYYETALLEISRKNFKTFNSAVIFILLMLTEPEFSRFFSVAPDLKLSSEMKLAIRKIIKTSPVLADEAENRFKVMRSEIRCNITNSEYMPLAYSNDRMDGKLANAFLADEAGAMDSYPIEAMRSSQITLRNKLGIIISTQYPNDNNAMIDEIIKSKRVLDGTIENKRRFSLLYEPDDEFTKADIWQTEDLIIYQSNPVAVSNDNIFEAIKERRADAILFENKRENYLCKHNNIKYKGLGVEGYVEITKVRDCCTVEDLDFWTGRRVFLGLDLSLTEDNTALAMVTDDNGNICAKVWGFIPMDKVEIKSKKESVNYARLINQGACFACGDEVIGYDFVEKFILELEEKYGVEIVQAGYDRMNAISTVQKLEAEGLECVEIKQHSSVLHMPTKLLKEQILRMSFRYDENGLLENNFQNARCTEDTNLNKYVNKKKSSGKVDMVVALINATYLLQQEVLYGNEYFVQVV